MSSWKLSRTLIFPFQLNWIKSFWKINISVFYVELWMQYDIVVINCDWIYKSLSSVQRKLSCNLQSIAISGLLTKRIMSCKHLVFTQINRHFASVNVHTGSRIGTQTAKFTRLQCWSLTRLTQHRFEFVSEHTSVDTA